jgi:hypothetical protein
VVKGLFQIFCQEIHHHAYIAIYPELRSTMTRAIDKVQRHLVCAYGWFERIVLQLALLRRHMQSAVPCGSGMPATWRWHI